MEIPGFPEYREEEEDLGKSFGDLRVEGKEEELLIYSDAVR